MALTRRKIRLLYVTYNENVLESGILFSQVRKMLAEVVSRGEVEYVRLLSFISPRLWLRCRRGYSHLKVELRDKGIDFRVRLMPAAQTWRWPAVPLLVVFCLPIILLHLITGNFGVIHSRGYGAGLLGLLASALTGAKFVFDPRGPFPEEMVLNGKWLASDTTFRFWKAVEKRLVSDSDAIIAVAPRFRKDFLALAARKAVYVPSRVDIEPFISAASKIPVFQNSLLFISDTAWYSIERIAKHFKSMKYFIPDLKLRLITRLDLSQIERVLDDSGIKRSDWLVKAATRDEIPELIAGSGFGLALGVYPSGNWQVWPIKFLEYLAAGVPVLVERQIGEHITHIVKRWKLGAVLDDDDPGCYRMAAAILGNRAEYSSRCIDYARKKLPISHCAAQYTRLYRQLLGN